MPVNLCSPYVQDQPDAAFEVERWKELTVRGLTDGDRRSTSPRAHWKVSRNEDGTTFVY